MLKLPAPSPLHFEYISSLVYRELTVCDFFYLFIFFVVNIEHLYFLSFITLAAEQERVQITKTNVY